MIAGRPDVVQGHRTIGDKTYYFKSLWEINYGKYLEFLKTHGEITDWQYEPETFWFDGIRRGVVSYKPDFVTFEKNGAKVYYEVKGYMDPRSATKLKRMKKYHPQVTLRLIDGKWFKEMNKKLKGLVPGWEEKK